MHHANFSATIIIDVVARRTFQHSLCICLTLLPIPPLPPRPRHPDHEELAAAEDFNREMAELAELEHQHELRSLLQARITGT